MANNQYVNKVEFGNETLIDLTSDTVAANKMLSGYTAHSKSGAQITGNIPTKTDTDITRNIIVETAINRFFDTIVVPAGYYGTNISSGYSTIYLPVPSTSYARYVVNVPNGTLNPSTSNIEDWIQLEISVDSEGNSNISDDTIPATGVSF